jgi:hypothetical protein
MVDQIRQRRKKIGCLKRISKGYYQWLKTEPSQREKEDAELLKQLEEVLKPTSTVVGVSAYGEDIIPHEEFIIQGREAREKRSRAIPV